MQRAHAPLPLLGPTEGLKRNTELEDRWLGGTDSQAGEAREAPKLRGQAAVKAAAERGEQGAGPGLRRSMSVPGALQERACPNTGRSLEVPGLL